jgi:hypothetical protein
VFKNSKLLKKGKEETIYIRCDTLSFVCTANVKPFYHKTCSLVFFLAFSLYFFQFFSFYGFNECDAISKPVEKNNNIYFTFVSTLDRYLLLFVDFFRFFAIIELATCRILC